MSLLDKWLSWVIDKYLQKHEASLLIAMQKVNEGGDIEDIDKIVMDYFYLIKSVYCERKPLFIEIESNCKLLIDGASYDFDELIRHNDERNTERKMEIDVLFFERIPLGEVQKRLNQKIAEEW